jgi:phosphoesterase RecJ-like protein
VIIIITDVYKKILKKIKEFDTIVIARHVGPDPDAIASQIALRDIIKLNFPKKNVYAVGIGVSKFKYLGTLDKQLDIFGDALLIITDVPAFDRVDGANKDNFSYTIKIDHHPCDEKVCDLELVDVNASSACQLVSEFAFKTKLKLTKEIAEILYAGIVSDTDRYLFAYTSPKTFNIVSKLLNDYKFDIGDIYENIYMRSIDERRLEAYIWENLTLTENGFGYIKLTNDIIKKFNVDLATPSNMVNDFNYIKEMKCWAFCTYDEKNKLYKINIRSRKLPINEVASKFNGGGHAFASGARLNTEEEVDELFKALDKACKDDN